MTMNRLCLPVLAASTLLLLSGCGDGGTDAGPGSSAGAGQGESAPATSDQEVSGTVLGCAADDPAVTGASTLAQADLDGDGTADPVRLTAPGGSCGGVVFAEVAGGFLAGQVPTDGPPVTSAFAIRPPGADADLVVTRQDHPRGGYQVRVLARTGDRLAELQQDGRPLLPFVATDVQEQPTSADCVDGGVAVTLAVPHEPAGVMFAFDVRRTVYTLGEDGAVTAAPAEEVADNVLPARLGKDFPALEQGALFAGCRVG